jgi:hypothetical protein
MRFGKNAARITSTMRSGVALRPQVKASSATYFFSGQV